MNNQTEKRKLNGIWLHIKQACSIHTRLPIKSILALVLVTALITPYFPHVDAMANEVSIVQQSEDSGENQESTDGGSDSGSTDGDAGSGDDTDGGSAGDSTQGSSVQADAPEGGGMQGYSLEDDDTKGGDTEGDGTEGDSTEGDGTEGDGSEGDGTEGDGTEGDGAEGDGTEGDGTEGDGTEGDGTEGDGTEGDGTEGDGTEGDGTEGDGTEGDNTKDGDKEDGDEEDNTQEEVTAEELEEELPAAPEALTVALAPFTVGNTITFGEYTCVEISETFSLPVTLVWDDNNSTGFRKGNFTLEVYGGDTKLKDLDVSVTNGVVDPTPTLDIPVYIDVNTAEGATGEGSAPGTYVTPDGFYTVKLVESSIKGYTIEGTKAADTSTVNLTIDRNALKWTADAKFTLTLAQLQSLTVSIVWSDSNDTPGERPKSADGSLDKFIKLIKLYSKTDDKEITSDNCDLYGFLSDAALTPEIKVESYSTWSCEFKNLPSKDFYVKIDEKAYKTEDGSKPILENYLTTYSDDSSPAPEDALDCAMDKGEINNIYAGVVTGTVQWFDAEYTGETPNPRPAFDEEHMPITLGVYEVSKPTTIIPPDTYTLEWTEGPEANEWSYRITTLPTYASDGGSQNTYVVKVIGANDSPTDKIAVDGGFTTVSNAHYSVGYDNKTTTTEKDQCYNGGYILAVLRADAVFTVTKEWKDSGDSNYSTSRTAAINNGITLYLWRYTDNPNKVAAVTQNGTQLSCTFTTGESAAGKLKVNPDHDNFQIGITNFGVTSLPRYDEKGNEYSYFVTETMAKDSGYRQVYTNVIPNPDELIRLNDKGVFHGGTLKNVRSGQVRVEATKLWNAQGVDDYKKSTVTLTLQKWNSGNNTWENVQNENKDLTGFTTSVKEKTVVFDAVNKYSDEDGSEIIYRVVETKITGKDIATVTLGDYEGSGDEFTAEYVYNSHPYEVVSEWDGSKWNITNALSGDIKYTIVKNWATDALAKWVADGTSPLTITLRQDGTPYAKVEMSFTGEPVAYSYTITGLLGNPTNPASPITDTYTLFGLTWTFDTLTLPAYDHTGRPYTYSVSESGLPSDAGMWPTYGYAGRAWDDTQKCYKDTATVTNHVSEPGDGGYTDIYVKKEWIDDNSLSLREPVTVVLATVDGGTATKSSYTATLSTQNNWDTHIRVPKSDFADEAAYTAFLSKVVAMEEKIGTDRTVSGTWDAGTIAPVAATEDEPAKPGYTYSVSGNPGDKNFIITNTIDGTATVSVTKEWFDADNAKDYRGAKLRIELYQSGNPSAYKTHEWTTPAKESFNPATDNIYTGCTFKDLPLFDPDTGAAYSYTVREFIVYEDSSVKEILLTDTAETAASRGTNYVSEMDEDTTESVDEVEKIFTQKSEFTFTNTATGKETDGTKFYIVWQDEDNLSLRPDASYQLYVSKGSDAPVPYAGTFQRVTESAEGDNPYYQVIKFSGMELFSNTGELYTYYLTQDISNNSNIPYDSKYYLSNSNIEETDFNVKDKSYHHHKAADGTQPLDDNMIPSNGAIINTIKDFINIKGTKLWINVEAGATAVDLPEANIYLWRISNYDETKKHTATQAGDDPTDYVAKTGLEHSQKKHYSFNDDPSDKLTEFDKYDEFGALYTYSVTEDIMYHLALITGQGGDADQYKHMPEVIMEPTGTMLALVNSFRTDTNSRKITVTKEWDVDDEDVSKEPAAKFQLYRGEYTPANIDANPPLPHNVSGIYAMPEIYDTIETARLNGGVYLVDEKILPRIGAATGSIVWDELPIFAPNAMSYVYFVCEVTDYVSGYNVTATVDSDKGSTDLGQDATRPLYVTLIGNENVNANDKSVGANPNTVAYKNEYKASATMATITGAKNWTDNNNIDQLRPKLKLNGSGGDLTDVSPSTSGGAYAGDGQTYTCADITLKLSRIAVSQDGVPDNKYSADNIPINVAWKLTDTNTWAYTITPTSGGDPFPVYAENGNPYTYTVTENYGSGAPVEKNYNKSPGAVSKSTVNASGTPFTALEMPDIGNVLKGTISAEKTWVDGYNVYVMRDNSVTLQLQRKLASDPDNGNWAAFPSSTTSDKVTASDDWPTVTWNHLPAVTGDGDAYEYRVLEIKIGTDDVPVDVNAFTAEGCQVGTASNAWISKTANYTVTHSKTLTLPASGKAEITNNLSSITTLTVTKTWVGDGYDASHKDGKYGQRPTSVTFELQWKYTDDADEPLGSGNNTWRSVLESDGTTVVTKTIPEDPATEANKKITVTYNADGGWTATLKNLPANNAHTKKPIIYRALEMDGTTVLSGGDMKDSYTVTYDNTTSGATVITNTLVERAGITVNKVWNDATRNGDRTDTVKVGLYSDNYFTDKYPSGPSAGKVDEVTLSYSNGFTHTWGDLPKLNMNQQEIVYYAKEIEVNGHPVNATDDTTAGTVLYHVDYYLGGTYQGANAGKATATALDSVITLVNTPYTTATATKVWNDDGDKFNLRPTKVDVTLQSKLDGAGSWSNVSTHELTGTTWTETIHGLIAYARPLATVSTTPVAYSYQFVETVVPSGYEIITTPPSTATDAGKFTTTITNKLIMSGAEYKMIKAWDDNNNQDGMRPTGAAAVNLELLYWKADPINGDGYVSFSPKIEKNLTAADSWTWTIGNLPAGGKYKVVEATPPDGYTLDETNDKTIFTADNGTGSGTTDITVTNIHTPGTVDYMATKYWIGDGSFKDELRPALDVTLYMMLEGDASGSEAQVTVDQSGYPITNPVMFASGASSTPAADSTSGVGFHADDGDGDRFRYTWTDLPEYIGGKEVIYYAKESKHTDSSGDLGAYKATATPSAPTANIYGVTIENMVQSITITGTKTWKDDNNVFGARPTIASDGKKIEGDALKLTVYEWVGSWQEIPENTHRYDIEWVQDADPDKWTYTITRLPKYSDVQTQTLARYAVKETAVPDFYAKTSPSGDVYQEGVTEFTNTIDGYVGGNITNADFTNTLQKVTIPLVVNKDKNVGPNSTKFYFKVLFSDQQITDPLTQGTVYKGAYKVFGESVPDVINDPTVDEDGDGVEDGIRNSSTTDGIITITALQKFVIDEIPNGYYYWVVEEDHFDYEFVPNDPSDPTHSSSNISGQVASGAKKDVLVYNKARMTDLTIINETPNETNSNARAVGGKVVVDSTNPDYYDKDSIINHDGDEMKAAWEPEQFWNLGSEVEIIYMPFGENGATKSVTIKDLNIRDGSSHDLEDLSFTDNMQKDELLALYPNASISMSGGIVTLSFGIIGSDIDPNKMPRSTYIYVYFTPTLAVNNVTPSNQGGMVQVENGNPSENADGVPALNGTPYSATKVFGTAATGYQLDLSQVALRNLNDLGGAIGPPMPLNFSSTPMFSPTSTRHAASTATSFSSLFAASAPLMSSSLSLTPMSSTTSTVYFSTTLQTKINGGTTTVDVTGSALLTKDASGNVTAGEFRLNKLPVPLQFDLYFVPAQSGNTGTTTHSSGGGSGTKRGNRGAGTFTTSPIPTPTPDPVTAPNPAEVDKDDSAEFVNEKEASPQTSDDMPVSTVATVAVLSGLGTYLSRKKTRRKEKTT